MKPSIRSFILAIAAMPFFFPALSAQDGGWKLKKTTDDIKVYYRKVDHSDINELKIEAILDGSLSAVVSVLKDVPNYSHWIYKCSYAERLEPAQNTSSLYYCLIDFPWPMDDRDFIARSTLRQDPATKHIYIDVLGEPRRRKDKQGVVRITEMNYHYELIPIANGKVKMLYQLHSDPGGTLPAWLVNLAIDSGPVNTVRGMQEMLKQETYRKAQLAFIQN